MIIHIKESPMFKWKIFIPISLVLLAFMVPLGAQNEETATRKIQPMPVELADEPALIIGGMRITIGEAIKQAIERNHTVLSGAYDVAMSDTDYQQFLKRYSTTLNGSIGAKYAENPEPMQLFYGVNQKVFDVSFSATRTFSTGTTVSGGIAHEYSKTKREAIQGMNLGLPKTQQPYLFVNIQQELVKNAFGCNDEKSERILKNATQIKRDTILYGLSLVVVGVVAEYWNLIIYQTLLDNARLQLQETQYVRDITARNVQLGLVDSYNLNYYNALVASAKSTVAAAEKTYHDALRDFLRSINMENSVEISGTAVLTEKLPEISEEEALKAAFAKRADYKSAVLIVETAKLNRDMQSNTALPSVIASINASTLAQREKFGSAYGDALTMTYPTIEGQISVSYPLDDKDQKVRERNAVFQLKQAEIDMDKTRREVKDDIASKIEQIKTYHAQYLSLRESRIQSELFYTNMLINMRRGRLTASVVKNGLDALVGSRQAELNSLVLYNVSLLSFDVAKNELWERYNIDVDKYIPKDKK